MSAGRRSSQAAIVAIRMEFEDALAKNGFVQDQDRPSRGATLFSATPNPYMTQSVHRFQDGTALFTWEFAIAEYLASRGIQVGDGEVLNLFMYPASDERGPADPAWLTSVLDRTDALLRSLDFADPAS
jgi:hypothetical protein